MRYTHIMKQSLNVSYNFDMFVIVNLSFLKAKQVAITNTFKKKTRQIKVKCLYFKAVILPMFYSGMPTMLKGKGFLRINS